MSGPVLNFGSELPADLLHNAASVCRLLADVAPAFVPEGGELGLEAEGAHGLSLILLAVEETIRAAIARL